MLRIDVLIIDDEKKFADMLTKRIILRGRSTEVCYDGAAALRWLEKKENSARLILLDLQLPDMYGTEVLGEIKKIDPLIPVVILTGHGSEKDRIACMELGAYRFVHKPLDIGWLVDIMDNLKEPLE